MSDLSMQKNLHHTYSASMAVLAAACLFLISIGCDTSKPKPVAPPLPDSTNPVVGDPERDAIRAIPERYPAVMSIQVPEEGMTTHGDDLSPNETDNANLEDPAVPVRYATWEDILANAKSAGKPTLVDVWSLACEPCMKEFPGLVKLQQNYGDKLNCISANVNFDGRRSHPPESYGAEIIRFLTFHDAKLNNYICSTANDLVFEALEIPSIPAVLLFDAQGNEVTRFVDAGDTRGFTYEKNIIPAVAELLGQSAQQDQAGDQVEQTQPLDQPEKESPTDTESDSTESSSSPTNQ